jgi:hypothetical protein
MLSTTRRRVAALVSTLGLILAVSLGAIFAAPGGSVNAGPEIVGNPDGAESRAIYADNNRVVRVEYFATGAKTMVGAGTPVVSDPVCGLNGTMHRADVVFSGTVSGTAPTLAILWQNSIDGVNWTNVGTWTQINATVTPATQSQAVGDVQATSANVYGDCWRASYTFCGSGTVTANFSVQGVEK